MSTYREEQLKSQEMVVRHLREASATERDQLLRMCRDYLRFREDVRHHQRRHLSALITRSAKKVMMPSLLQQALSWLRKQARVQMALK